MLLRYCLEKKKKEIIKHFQHHPSHLATGASVSLSFSRARPAVHLKVLSRPRLSPLTLLIRSTRRFHSWLETYSSFRRLSIIWELWKSKSSSSRVQLLGFGYKQNGISPLQIPLQLERRLISTVGLVDRLRDWRAARRREERNWLDER